VPDNLVSTCQLCLGSSTVFYQFKDRLYHQCSNCRGIFVDEGLRPDRVTEKLRYEEHNNDVMNEKYQQFVTPITEAIFNNHSKEDKGLDFGAGTGPVISKLLKDSNYCIGQYDPLFHNYPALLNDKYDYIACCEVIEHFHNPKKDFGLLKKLLKKGASLYCMTHLYDESIDFHNWYYKNDPTHVFIYQKPTIHWIQQEFGFLNVTIADRLITFSN
jgi:SAM-dependent methyltransferase